VNRIATEMSMQQELTTARRPLRKRKIFVRWSTYEGDCESAS